METKQEFLDGLRRALNGKISPQEIEVHIRYYDDYITAEMRGMRAEKDVLDSLGSPRLIAMSICDATAAGEKADRVNDASEDTNAYYEAYDNYEQSGDKGKDDRPFVFRHPKLTIFLIIVAILVILGLGIWLAISLVSFFWPVIVAIIMVVLLLRLISFIRENW